MFYLFFNVVSSTLCCIKLLIPPSRRVFLLTISYFSWLSYSPKRDFKISYLRVSSLHLIQYFLSVSFPPNFRPRIRQNFILTTPPSINPSASSADFIGSGRRVAGRREFLQELGKDMFRMVV